MAYALVPECIGCDKVRFFFFSSNRWDWCWLALKSTWGPLQHVKALKPRKEKCLFFSLSSPPSKNRNKLQWFTLVMPVSCLCRSLRGVRVLCAHTSRSPGQPRARPPPARPGHPPSAKGVFCFERREWSGVGLRNVGGGLQWGVCFFLRDSIGLGRVVELQTFCSLEAFVTWLEMAKIKRWNKWTKTANYVCLVLFLEWSWSSGEDVIQSLWTHEGGCAVLKTWNLLCSLVCSKLRRLVLLKIYS